MKNTFVFVFLCLVSVSILNAQTAAGPNTGSTVVNNTSFGVPWTITSYSMAYITLNANEQSQGITATNFGFNIPPTATIVGVEAIFSYSYTTFVDTFVRLVVNNLEVGSNKAMNTSLGAFGSRTYGASNDLWGLTLTPADINSPNFGFVVYIDSYTSSYPPTLYLYPNTGFPFRMKVYYSTTTGIIQTQTSNDKRIYYFDKFLYLKLPELNQKTSIKVFNSYGLQILERDVLENARIDLSAFSAGIYFYSLECGHQTQRGKFAID